VDGATINQVDRCLKKFGMPLGPLALADNVGLDVGVNVLKVLNNAYGERMKVAEFAPIALKEHKWLGKKVSKGFYQYSSAGKFNVHKEMELLIHSFKVNGKQSPSEQDIVERCIFLMFNEATRCLDESIVMDADQLDFAMIMGVGFPPYLGGLCKYAEMKGLSYVVSRLSHFENIYGARFTPSEFLITLEKNNKTLFYKEK